MKKPEAKPEETTTTNTATEEQPKKKTLHELFETELHTVVGGLAMARIRPDRDVGH